MSAINKSGKRFTPKIKQRSRRVTGLMTPQASQQQTGSQKQLTPVKPRVEFASQIPMTQIPKESEGSGLLNSTDGKKDNEKHENGDNNSSTSKDVTNNSEGIVQGTVDNNEQENTENTLDSDEEKLSDVEELKTDNKEKLNRDGKFAQPSMMPPRARLNSLTIPTQITARSSSRRGSVNINNTNYGSNSSSRRGSVTQSDNLNTSRSRRGSIASLNLNSDSRRGSMNTLAKPIFAPGYSTSRRGSLANDDEKPAVSISIPVMKNKKRRISVTLGPKKKREVNVGGIAIGNEIIRKSSISQGDKSDKDRRITIDDKITNQNKSEAESKDKNYNNSVQGEENIDKNINNENIEKENSNEGFKEEIAFTGFEKELKKKWVLNKETRTYNLVDIDSLSEDVVMQRQYRLNHKIENLSQIINVTSKIDARLSDSLTINEDSITMKELCKPFFPVGKRSNNYDKAIEGEKKLIEAQKVRSAIRRKAKDLRMSEKDVIKLTEIGTDINSEMNEKERLAKVKELMEINKDENKGKSHNVPLLQLQDGLVTYNHESTVVDRHEDANVEMERVEENPFENIVTSNTYSKRSVTMKWTPQEIAELLKAVSTWGTDFGLIAKLFPNRTRKQIKAKFLLEEKKRPHLVEFALLRKLPIDIREYSGKTGLELKTLNEYNKELEILKSKHEEELKMMAEAKDKAQAEDREAQQSLLHSTGGIPPRRSKKAVLAEFRKNEEVVGVLDNAAKNVQ